MDHDNGVSSMDELFPTRCMWCHQMMLKKQGFRVWTDYRNISSKL